MINTELFQALERYKRLEAMLAYIEPKHDLQWVRSMLCEAIAKEWNCIAKNKDHWIQKHLNNEL